MHLTPNRTVLTSTGRRVEGYDQPGARYAADTAAADMAHQAANLARLRGQHALADAIATLAPVPVRPDPNPFGCQH